MSLPLLHHRFPSSVDNSSSLRVCNRAEGIVAALSHLLCPASLPVVIRWKTTCASASGFARTATATVYRLLEVMATLSDSVRIPVWDCCRCVAAAAPITLDTLPTVALSCIASFASGGRLSGAYKSTLQAIPELHHKIGIIDRAKSFGVRDDPYGELSSGHVGLQQCGRQGGCANHRHRVHRLQELECEISMFMDLCVPLCCFAVCLACRVRVLDYTALHHCIRAMKEKYETWRSVNLIVP